MRKLAVRLITVAAIMLLAHSANAAAIRWGLTTVAGLPATCEPEGHGYIVIDANPDCDTGGGSTHKICFCNAAGTGYNTLSIHAADILDTIDVSANTNLAVSAPITLTDDTVGLNQNGGTDVTADLEEEAQVGTTNVTGNAADDYYLNGTGANAATWAALPAGGTSGCSGSGDKPLYNSATNSWSCGTDLTGATPTLSWSWPSWNMNPDGTKCKDVSVRTVGSGPHISAIQCDDDAGSAIYFNVQNQTYAGGTLVFSLSAINSNATPSGVLDFDFSAQCRGDGDAVDSTWGTAQSASITFSTQDVLEIASTAAVTPNGTCSSDDFILVRAVMDSVSTTTQTADTRIYQVSVLEQ